MARHGGPGGPGWLTGNALLLVRTQVYVSMPGNFLFSEIVVLSQHFLLYIYSTLSLLSPSASSNVYYFYI